MIHYGLAHLDGRANGDEVDSGRLGERDGSGNEDYAGAPGDGRFRKCESHLAAGPIGDVADGVERLLGRARGHHYRFTL